MPAYQQGVLPLVDGQQEYELTFPGAFASVPNMILTQVFNQDPGETSPLYIEGIVTVRSATACTITLTQVPNSDDYLLSWFAGDMSQIVSQPPNPGKGLLGLPEFSGPIPGNAYLPAVIPGKRPSTELIRVSSLLHTFSANHQHVARQIVDASVPGRTVLTGTAVEGRAALHVPSEEAVAPALAFAASATVLGTQLVTASSQAQALLALGTLSTTELQPAVDLASNATITGVTLLYSADEAAVRTFLDVPSTSHTHTLGSLGAAAAIHTHATSDITGSAWVTGFLTAASATLSRAAIKAATTERTIANISSGSTVNLSTYYTTTPSEVVFVCQGATTVNIDSIGSLTVGQSFELQSTDNEINITRASDLRLNDGVADVDYQAFVIPAGSALTLTLVKSVSGIKYLRTNLPYQARPSARIWVSEAYGSDTKGIPGRQDRPYATLSGAAADSVASDLIIVTPGTYTPAANLNTTGARWHFEKGAFVQSSYTSPLFASSTSFPNIVISGSGSFAITGPLASAIHSGGVLHLDCDQITTFVPGSTYTVLTAGNSSNNIEVKFRAHNTVNRPLGSLLTVPSGALTVTADLDLDNAHVLVQEVVTGTGPYKVSATGGRIYLGTGLVSGTAGGVTDSALRIRNAQALGNQSDISPATVTTGGSHVFVTLDNISRISTYIKPGTGYLVVKDSVTVNDITLDSNKLLMINCSSTSGTYSTLAAAPYNLNIGGILTTNAAVPLTNITLLGGTNVVLSGISSFAPAF